MPKIGAAHHKNRSSSQTIARGTITVLTDFLFLLLAVSAIAMNRFTIILANVESVYCSERRKEGPSRKKEENGEMFQLQDHETIERLQTHRRQRKDSDSQNLSIVSCKKNRVLLEYSFAENPHA